MGSLSAASSIYRCLIYRCSIYRCFAVVMVVLRWPQAESWYVFRRIADISGASVEHNTFCVSVHFRNCEESSWEDVQVTPSAVSSQRPSQQGV